MVFLDFLIFAVIHLIRFQLKWPRKWPQQWGKILLGEGDRLLQTNKFFKPFSLLFFYTLYFIYILYLCLLIVRVEASVGKAKSCADFSQRSKTSNNLSTISGNMGNIAKTTKAVPSPVIICLNVVGRGALKRSITYPNPIPPVELHKLNRPQTMHCNESIWTKMN